MIYCLIPVRLLKCKYSCESSHSESPTPDLELVFWFPLSPKRAERMRLQDTGETGQAGQGWGSRAAGEDQGDVWIFPDASSYFPVPHADLPHILHLQELNKSEQVNFSLIDAMNLCKGRRQESHVTFIIRPSLTTLSCSTSYADAFGPSLNSFLALEELLLALIILKPI